MRTYKARGVVLHTIKYGDSSMVAYLFTDLYGRMNYMIQGVHSSRGRGNKAALFQPMFLVEFEGIEQPQARMHRMKEVRSLTPLSSLPFDVRKSTISLFMAEVLYRLIPRVGGQRAAVRFRLPVGRAVGSDDRGSFQFSPLVLGAVVRLPRILSGQRADPKRLFRYPGRRVYAVRSGASDLHGRFLFRLARRSDGLRSRPAR